jgi:hypothetical protein
MNCPHARYRSLPTALHGMGVSAEALTLIDTEGVDASLGAARREAS